MVILRAVTPRRSVMRFVQPINPKCASVQPVDKRPRDKRHDAKRRSSQPQLAQDKCFAESELTLIGIDRDRKTGAARALLAKADRSKPVYGGAAFLALNEDAREDLKAKFALWPKNVRLPLAAQPYGSVGQTRAHHEGEALSQRNVSARHATVKAVC